MTDIPKLWRSGPTVANEQDCACPADAPAMLWTEASQDASETDCACVQPLTGAPASPAALGLRRQAPDVIALPIAPGYTLLANPLRSGEVALLNRPALDIFEGYKQPRPPSASLLERQLTSLALLEPATDAACPRSTSGVLVAWLHLTHACNLACRYCYLPPAQGTMDESTIEAAARALVRSAVRGGYGALKLKYAGGEPTLHFDRVKLMHARITTLTSAAALRLEEVLLTNGTQLQAGHVAYLHENGIRLMISLDGVAEAHDAARPARSGASTVVCVQKAVDLAVAGGVTPHLSITVTRLNLAELAALTDFALERGLPFNLNFYRPGPQGPELRPHPDELIVALVDVLDRIAKRRGAASLLGGWLDRLHTSAPHDRTCGAGDNYVVVDPDGRIARCHMILDRPVTDISNVDLLTTIRQPGATFHNARVAERPTCRDCQWRHWCGGGCPLDAFWAAGAWDAPSPYCEVYRSLIPKLLHLEGLRLLKQAQITH